MLDKKKMCSDRGGGRKLRVSKCFQTQRNETIAVCMAIFYSKYVRKYTVIWVNLLYKK